jgi:hypothetical protein
MRVLHRSRSGREAVKSDTSYPPTVDEINALPDNLRRWIHELETNADPAGTIRRCALLEQENAQLRAALAERDDNAERYVWLRDGNRLSANRSADLHPALAIAAGLPGDGWDDSIDKARSPTP